MKNLSQKPPLWQLHKKHNCFSLIFGLTNPSGKPYSRKGRKGFSTLFQFIIAYSNTSNTNGEETGRRPVSMYMNSMDNNTFYSFSLEKPLSYVATGKFEAPSQEWIAGWERILSWWWSPTAHCIWGMIPANSRYPQVNICWSHPEAISLGGDLLPALFTGSILWGPKQACS